MHLVMFDIDGTLVDSNGFDGELYAPAMREVTGADVDRCWQSYRHVTDGGILAEVLAPLAAGGFSRRSYFGDGPWDLAASRELAYDFLAVGSRVQHDVRFPDLTDTAGILAALDV
jgi:hypothetical protein